VIIFLSVFPPFRGGISRFSDFLFKTLSKNTEIKAYNFKTLYPELLFPGKSQFEDEPSQDYSDRILHSFNPLNWNHAGNQISKEKPESLIISYWHPFFLFAYAQMIKNVRKNSPNTKIVSIAHNILPHERFPFSKQLMKWFFKKNDLVVTLSEQTESEFKSLNSDTQCLKLFHPIYETAKPTISEFDLRKKYGFEEQDNIILFFGIIREYKGLDVMIEALNKLALAEHKIKPFIVGEFYDEKDKYLKIIKPEDSTRYTIIDRFVTTEESSEIFSISDLLILPYKSASQSGVLADALNFNLPSLVANHAGLTEHIQHGENGLIFESENSAELSSTIKDFFSKNVFQKNIKLNITTKKDQLTWLRFTSQLLKHLQELEK